MDNLILKSSMTKDYICLSKIFIEEYMPKASGEFTKIYLYLLSALSDGSDISVSDVADALDYTNKDVLRALNYWKNEGLIDVGCGEDDEMTPLTFLPVMSKSELRANADAVDTIMAVTRVPATVATDKTPVDNTVTEAPAANDFSNRASSDDTLSKRTYSAAEIANFKNDSEFKCCMANAEALTGKPLSMNDVQILTRIIDVLGFSHDLFEELCEQCYTTGHKSMRYLETVANDWYDKGYETAEDARNNHVAFKKIYGIVMDAFGLKGSGVRLNSEERQFIDKWTDDYGFTDEIIEVACLRTKAATNKGFFKYADAILKDWAVKKVKTLSDIDTLDKIHFAKASKAKTSQPKLSIVSSKPADNSALEKINARRKVMGLEPFTKEEYDEILLKRQEQ